MLISMRNVHESSGVYARVHDVFVNVIDTVVMFIDLTEYCLITTKTTATSNNNNNNNNIYNNNNDSNNNNNTPTQSRMLVVVSVCVHDHVHAMFMSVKLFVNTVV